MLHCYIVHKSLVTKALCVTLAPVTSGVRSCYKPQFPVTSCYKKKSVGLVYFPIRQFQKDLAFSESVSVETLKALLKTEVRLCADAELQKAGIDCFVWRGRWVAADLKVSRHPYRDRVLVEILEWSRSGQVQPGWAARLGKTEIVLFLYFRPIVLAVEANFLDLYIYARRRLNEVLLGAKTDSSVVRDGRIALFDLPETKLFDYKLHLL